MQSTYVKWDLKNKSLRKKKGMKWSNFPLEKTQLVGRRKGITFIKLLSVADPALAAFHVPLYLPFLFIHMEIEVRSHDLTWLVTLPVYY